MARAKSNAMRTALVKMRKLDEGTNDDSWMLPTKQREVNAWQVYISQEIDISKELDANFHFPKIHLMSHWAKQIRRYGALQQYSAESDEQVHKTNLKDGWKASNYNLNYLPQVITFQRRIHWLEIRELNLQTLILHWENSADACKFFPSGANLRTPLTSQSHATPEFMGPQNHRDGKHLDSRIKDSKHYTTICKTQRTEWQYTAARGRLSSIRAVT
jgi:hypothetical protein